MRTSIRTLIKLYLTIIACCFISLACAQSQKKPPKTKKPTAIKTKPLYQQTEVQEFINKMVKEHNFKRAQLIKLFKQVQIKQPVIRKIKHPYEEVPWRKYQQHFITPERINDGVKFWHKYAATLKRAYLKFGVPPSIIVAIIGVESKYGEETGKFKVINTLSTISFKHTKRAEYFQKELAQFLLFCRENKINPLDVYGSYAGAIGQPQFMPSNIRKYAVDFDKSEKIDLIHDAKDSIGSIANFFQAHGWRKHNGVNLSDKLITLIRARNKNNLPYKSKLHNMYVIMTYNVNIQYALVVYQLSQEIKKAYLRSLKKPPISQTAKHIKKTRKHKK
ncbi:MAG: lytic murein transglycosylase B [Gammaproteobacteria bacterium]|jgi:membrane-bound lytic murein transglycosylase B